MHLGAFSIGLNVKDLAKSAEFYHAFGCETFHGTAKDGWVMLRQADAVPACLRGILRPIG